MSISTRGFRIEVNADQTTWMDSYSRPEIWSDYVNGVSFNPAWGIFALVYDIDRNQVCLLQFANKKFFDTLSDFQDKFTLIQLIESPQAPKQDEP